MRRWAAFQAVFVAVVVAGLLALSPSPADARALCPKTSGAVVVFGDSMTVGATPLLNQVRPAWRIDAQWGRGVTFLPRQIRLWEAAHDRSPRVAVIALGTNEQASWTRASYVNAIRMFPRSTRIVLVNTNRPGAGAAGLSDGLQYSQWMIQIAQSPDMKHRVSVANWRRVSRSDPSMISEDGTHQSPAGIREWVRVVLEAEARVSRAKGCRR